MTEPSALAARGCPSTVAIEVAARIDGLGR